MSLVEILIAVALLALMAGTLLAGSGLFIGTQQRLAASLIVGAVRKGLSVANASGKPTRLAVDFMTSRVILQQSASALALREPLASDVESYEKEMLAQAIAQSEQMVAGIRKHKPEFYPLDALGQDGDLPGRELGRGVTMRLVQTEHDEEPIVEGVAYLYFWPGGLTENAVLQLGQGDGDGLTVVVSALTGRARIERGRIPLPESPYGEDEGEREEP